MWLPPSVMTAKNCFLTNGITNSLIFQWQRNSISQLFLRRRSVPSSKKQPAGSRFYTRFLPERVSELARLEVWKCGTSRQIAKLSRSSNPAGPAICNRRKRRISTGRLTPSPALAEPLKVFLGEQNSGLVFSNRAGTPLSQTNITLRSLHPILKEIKAEKTGFHAMRRFRAIWLRKQRAPEDLRDSEVSEPYEI